jgi:hypothetical protein
MVSSKSTQLGFVFDVVVDGFVSSVESGGYVSGGVFGGDYVLFVPDHCGGGVGDDGGGGVGVGCIFA